MSTPVLTVEGLCLLIAEHSTDALKPREERIDDECDRMLLGKLHVLERISDRLFLHEIKLSPDEARELAAARDQLGRACDHLEDPDRWKATEG